MRAISILVSSLACFVLASGAWADKGKGHGHGHENGHENGPAHIVIGDHDRAVVYSYYRAEFVGGHCPPGLARKDNGCLSPGLAKRAWTVGLPLAAAITFYPLPPGLLAQLTPAPAGYEYVRVDNDVLLVATSTRVVTATLGNLSNLQGANMPLIADPDRDAVASYYRSQYLAGDCPSGLMRTDLGCQVKPLWALGAPLDPSVTYERLPDPLLAQLSPPVDGYTYIRLGDHVLLMAAETRIIRADVLDLSHLPLATAHVAVSPPVAAVVTAPSAVVVPERVEVSGGGFCPPGLAKKHNGCLPPGHSR